ncbi:MAG: DUF3467 domain-containing protein [Phycisphaerales bacterium]
MSDSNTPPAQPQQRQVQLRIDESKMETTYANTIRTSTTPDEVILDFGVNLPMPSNNNTSDPVLVFSVGSRVVMNWRGAKRLAISLGQVIRQYEQANGEINLNPDNAGGPKLAQ